MNKRFSKSIQLVVAHKSLFFFVAFISVLIGLSLSSLVQKYYRPLASFIHQQRQNDSYQFINPLLECEVSENLGAIEFKTLESKVKDYIDKAVKSGTLNTISYYYRDLNIGPWIGVNEQEEFTPSSLLKVPIMIAALKQAENNPDFLKTQIEYKEPGEPELTPVFPPSQEVELGKTYLIEELINRMIIYSDNRAKNLLISSLDPKFLDNVYKDLSIVPPPEMLADNFMTVKEYASLFRVLFNASYLSHDMSEKALNLLSQTEFKLGLINGVPANIKVANKFGERELLSGVDQLHDCGIVYFPSRPYLLCVMTRGNNIQALSKSISDLSKITYEEMKSRYK